MKKALPVILLLVLSFSNCFCQCPPGFIGNDCRTPIAPASITITRIEIMNWPDKKSDGTPWQQNTGPNIYVVLQNLSRNSATLFDSKAVPDCRYGNIYKFYCNINIKDVTVNDNYKITLNNKNQFLPNELMSGETFKLYNPHNGCPPTLTISNNAVPPITVKLFLTYTF